MTQKTLLYAIGCKLDAVYRTRIEANSLAKHIGLTLWDIGDSARTSEESAYSHHTHITLPMRHMIWRILPKARNLLLRHGKWKMGLLLGLFWLILLPLSIRGAAPQSDTSQTSPEASSKDRVKKCLRRLGLYNHGKCIAFIVLMLRHSLTHYAAWLRDPKPYDIISIKDVDCLLFGVLLKLQTGSKLIYNCYEFSAHTMPEMPRWASWFILRYERGLIDQVDTIITVTPSMADQIRIAHKLFIPITWVPNVDPLPTSSAQQKHDLFEQANGRIIFYYQGTFSAERGLDELISAWQHVDSTKACLFLRGPDDQNQRKYKTQAEHLGLNNNAVYFLPPIAGSTKESLEESLGFLQAIDVGLILYDPACANNLNACPRKLSHYLLAGRVLLSTPMLYVKSVIDEASCGLTLSALSPEAIAKGVERIVADKAVLAHYKENALLYAKNQYHWEYHEKHYLEAVLPRD
ncbi:MAG: glycosyltransferase [Rickettsiales bacterium]